VSLLHFATTVPDKTLAAVRTGQGAMIRVARAYTDTVGKAIPAPLQQSVATQAGKLAEVVDSACARVEKLLASQRQWATNGWVQPMAKLVFRALPKLSAVIDTTFEFTTKLVASQRHFANELLHATVPSAKATTAARTKPVARIQPPAEPKPAAQAKPAAWFQPAAEANPAATTRPKAAQPKPKISVTHATA
jgi:hypothetical protein